MDRHAGRRSSRRRGMRAGIAWWCVHAESRVTMLSPSCNPSMPAILPCQPLASTQSLHSSCLVVVRHVFSGVAGHRPRLDGPRPRLRARLPERAHRLLLRRGGHRPGRHIHMMERGVHLGG